MTDDPLRKPTALIVDDEQTHREILRRRVEPYFFVIEASTSEEAIAIMKGVWVDVLFSDNNLPVREGPASELPRVDGKEMVRLLRFEAGYKGIIIFASASASQPGVYMEMADAGADEILVKPFKGERVIGVLRDLFGNRLLTDKEREERLGKRQRRQEREMKRKEAAANRLRRVLEGIVTKR